MAEEAAVSPREIKKIAERALVLQSYLLRRAWAVLYAALSLAMFVTIFVTPSEPTIAIRFVVNIAASGTALIAILWEFKRARNTAEIRNAIVDRRWSKPLGYRVLLPLWVAIYAILILTVIFLRPQAVSVILVIYAALAVSVYYALRLSFPLRLPPEGIVALSSLAVAAMGSIAFLPFVRDSAPYAILWGATIALWLLAAAYARTRPPPAPTEAVPT